MLPVVLLGMLVRVGWDSLRRLWMTSPYVLVLLTLVFGAVMPAASIADDQLKESKATLGTPAKVNRHLQLFN
jgi:hypothetical protein